MFYNKKNLPVMNFLTPLHFNLKSFCLKSQIFLNSHQQLSLSKNPEFHEYNSIFIQLKVFLCFYNSFLLFSRTLCQNLSSCFWCTLCLLIQIKLPPLFLSLFMTGHSGKGSCQRRLSLGDHLIPLSNMILNYTSQHWIAIYEWQIKM